jgi:hypothetical protein
MRLIHRAEYKHGDAINQWIYDYTKASQNVVSRTSKRRVALARRCVQGTDDGRHDYYNFRGLIESGSYIKDGNLVRFKCHYREDGKFEDELLRTEFVLPHLSCTVSWCAPPTGNDKRPENWVWFQVLTKYSHANVI